MSIATALLKKPRSHKYRTAYTLVELLVVMAALTVLAAVTLPSLKTLLHDQKVSSASRMVKAHFEAAQARAIASNSPVAVILECSDTTSPNTVSRLSIGQVFPPYEGDTTGTSGTLGTAVVGGAFYDTLTVNVDQAILLNTVPPIFGQGDYLQLDDRQRVYVVDSILPLTPSATKAITFVNATSGHEGDLQKDIRRTDKANFRLFRKPTKSFLQTLILPRGTCVDLSVSGVGQQGDQFKTTVNGLAMIVFNPQGRIAYLNNADPNAVQPPADSLLHVLIGKTDQVSTTVPPMELTEPEGTSLFNGNINDNDNTWLTVNPFTGAITSSNLQPGDETGTFGDRLKTSRSFATYGITQSE